MWYNIDINIYYLQYMQPCAAHISPRDPERCLGPSLQINFRLVSGRGDQTTGDSVRLSFVIVSESQNHHKPTLAIFQKIYSIYIHYDIYTIIYTILYKFYDLCEIQGIYSIHCYIDECFYNLLIYALMNFLLTCFCNIFCNQVQWILEGSLDGASWIELHRQEAWPGTHWHVYSTCMDIYIYI